jgi:tRNA-splicing ligase RtcB
MTQYNVDTKARHPIKHWTRGVHLDERTMDQLRNVANLPFIHKHVAAMPDAHWGLGATVGSVIATKGAICPAAVGVDIGCGMMALRTSLRASDLPESLRALRLDLEAAVPHGRTNNGGAGDKGAFADAPEMHSARLMPLWEEYRRLVAKHPQIESGAVLKQMGTLGGGNHFIELCLDEHQQVWVMLHSGSRGAGNKIGVFFIEKARREMEKYHTGDLLPDKDLAYLVEHTELFDDYVEALDWAQRYAMANRQCMMDAILSVLVRHLKPFTIEEEAVNCHHNYVAREHHFGADVLVTRKGAVRAGRGDLGIIPGSMGTGSFIVRGLGNQESFCSCSHGAGRVMSRDEARRQITLDDHKKAMTGIEARLDAGVIDESPAAYKDINAVMQAQSDLVEVLYHLKQVLNIKG